MEEIDIIPNNDTLIKEELLKKGILLIKGNVDNRTYEYIYNAILRLEISGSPDIEIRFESEGGSYFFGLKMYDLFKNYKGKKTGIAIGGRIYSIALLILQSCDIRKASKYSSALAHYGESNVKMDVVFDRKHLKEILGDSKRTADKMLDVLSIRCKISKKKLHKHLLEDREINTKEALKIGFIDEII